MRLRVIPYLTDAVELSQAPMSIVHNCVPLTASDGMWHYSPRGHMHGTNSSQCQCMALLLATGTEARSAVQQGGFPQDHACLPPPYLFRRDGLPVPWGQGQGQGV